MYQTIFQESIFAVSAFAILLNGMSYILAGEFIFQFKVNEDKQI